MQPTPPFWFRQRQGKIEKLDEQTLRLTAPNMAEAIIAVRREDEAHWAGMLRSAAAGPEIDGTPAKYATAEEAWQAAFELHRRHNVV